MKKIFFVLAAILMAMNTWADDFITVSITAVDKETEIYVNEQYCGTGHCNYKFMFNTHYDIEGRRKGCQTHIVERHDFNANSPKTIAIPELKRLYGKLNISFLPKEATLKIDGITRPTKNGEFSDSRMPLGQHVIQVYQDGYRSVADIADIESGELTAKSYELIKESQSQNSIVKAKIGDLFYLLNASDKTAQVTYKIKSDRNGYNHNWKIKQVDIPQTIKYKDIIYKVTSIGRCAFYNCEELVTVNIPESVTDIEMYAFYKCKHLTHIVIPSKVKEINPWTFYDCSCLMSVILPKSLIRIGDYAFSGCKVLSKISIPGTVNQIGSGAFSDCASLVTIAIPINVTDISRSLFSGCGNLEFVVIPENVTRVGAYAFASCKKLSTLTIPCKVTYVGDYAFIGCSSLAELHHSNGLTIRKESKVPTFTKVIKYETDIREKKIENRTSVAPPLLTLVDGSLSYIDNSKNNRLDANENSTIKFKINNQGKGAANDCQVRVKMSGATGGINIGAVTLPSIAVGKVYDVSIPISTDIYTQNGNVTFSIEVYEPNGWGIAPFDITLATKAYDPPLLQVVDYKVASNSGKIRKMEPFTLTFNLQNTKYGDAEDVKVKISLPSNVYVMDGNAELSYPLIKSGEAKPIQLVLAANNNYPTTNIPVAVTIQEKYGKFAENKQLDIALNQAASSSIKIAAIDDSQKERKEIQLALLRSDVDLNIPLSNATNPNTFAVIIANENYEQVAKVPYAINDGNIFKQYCEKTLGIPSTNIHFVSDATINNIRQQVNWLSQVSQAYNGQASIIFYYAGHGVPDEQSKTAFLLPKDGNGMDITTGYKLDDLYKKLGQLPAKSVTIFLDACFSGSKREDGMLTSARGVAIKVKNGQPVGKMVVFTAATGDETAYPNNKEGHGMFTYYLLKKLQETSGNVTYEELGDYIRQNVSRQSVVLNGKLQTPTVIPSADATDWQNWKLK